MYQVDNTTAAATMPAAPTAHDPGYFTEGNPGSGVAPTILPAHFLNVVMLELLNVLDAAGVNPSRTNTTQVATSIGKLIAKALLAYGLPEPETALTDIEAVRESGFHAFTTTAANRPAGVDEGYAITVAFNNAGGAGDLGMLYFDPSNNEFYARTQNESGWNGWRKLMTTAA